MSSETFLDGRIVLYHGDCVSIVPTLERFNHVFSDPPYEDRMHAAKAEAADGRNLRTDGGPELAPLDFDSINVLRPIITPLLVEKCDGWLLAFCTPEGIAPWRDAIEAADGRYKRACFWYKPDSTPQLNGQGPAFAVEPFVAAWCGKGYSRWNGGGGRNLFEHFTNGPGRHGEHKTEKPVSLMTELVDKFSSQDDLICDPFMGSGTTGVACAKRGRRFIGIEKNERYFQIACERVGAAAQQPDMFVDAPKPVQQKLFEGAKP